MIIITSGDPQHKLCFMNAYKDGNYTATPLSICLGTISDTLPRGSTLSGSVTDLDCKATT